MVVSILTLLTLVLAATATKLDTEAGNDIILDLLSTLPEDYEDRGWVSRCPHIEGFSDEKMFWDNLELCFTRNYGEQEIHREFTASNTTEEVQDFLKRYCSTLPTIHQCFDNLTYISEACLTDAQQALFALHVQNFRLASNVLCYKDGQRFAFVLSEIKSHSRKSEFPNCGRAMVDALKPFSISVDTLTQYRALKSFRECVVGLQQGEDITLNIGKEVLDEFLRGMHCAGQQQGTPRLCEGVDTAS